MTICDCQAKKLPEGDEHATEEDWEEEDEEESEEVLAQKQAEEEEKHGLAKELSDLVVICQAIRFKSFDHSRENCKNSFLKPFPITLII